MKEVIVATIVFFSGCVVPGMSASVIFSKLSNDTSRRSMEIPLDLMRQSNDGMDADELWKNMLGFIGLPADISGRIGSERGSPAKCMPELRTVRLQEEDQTSTAFYYPSCTRVERCGGCCSHHLLSCQPIEVEQVPVRVIVADYSGINRLNYREQKLVHVERHIKCKCDCKIQPENCKAYQRYNPHTCQCECKNAQEAKKCMEAPHENIWSPNDCLCLPKVQLWDLDEFQVY